MRGRLQLRIVPVVRPNRDEAEVLTIEWPSVWGAFASPARLLLILIVLLLCLHLQTHGMNLLCFDAKSLEQRLTGLLVATKPAETGSISVLLSAVDTESHFVTQPFLSSLRF